VTSPTTRPTIKAAEPVPPKQRREPKETAELAAAIEQMNPQISDKEIAEQLGITPARLRQVRREVASTQAS
jgi:hypothetical protein